VSWVTWFGTSRWTKWHRCPRPDQAVAQFRDEQSMTIEVECQMVDASIDLPEWNLRLDAQRSSLLSVGVHWEECSDRYANGRDRRSVPMHDSHSREFERPREADTSLIAPRAFLPNAAQGDVEAQIVGAFPDCTKK
jgi:hypothetical protein